MKIIQKFGQNEVSSIDNNLIQHCQQGKCIDWKRTFIVRNLDDDRIAIVSLNIFERIIWWLQEVFCCQSYYKFESIFNTKKVKVLSQSEMNSTMQKARDSATVQSTQRLNSVVEMRDPAPGSVLAAPATAAVVVETPQSEPDLVSLEWSLQDENVIIDILISPTAEDASNPNPTPALTQAQKIENDIIAGNLEEAIKAVEELSYREQQKHYCNIARAYFLKDNYPEVIRILNNIVISSVIIDPIYKEFAIVCCQKEKYSDVPKFIKEMSGFTKERIIDEIFLAKAEELYKNGDVGKVLEAISYLKDDKSDAAESFYLKIANTYLVRNELVEAAKWAQKILYKSDDKKELLSGLAERFYQKKDLKSAFEFNQYNTDKVSVKALYIKIAKDYNAQADRVEAIKVLQEIVNYGGLIKLGSKTAINERLQANDFDTALLLILSSPIRI